MGYEKCDLMLILSISRSGYIAWFLIFITFSGTVYKVVIETVSSGSLELTSLKYVIFVNLVLTTCTRMQLIFFSIASRKCSSSACLNQYIAIEIEMEIEVGMKTELDRKKNVSYCSFPFTPCRRDN